MKSRFILPLAIVSVSSLLFFASCKDAAAKIAPAPTPIDTVSDVELSPTTVPATSEADLKATIVSLQSGQFASLSSSIQAPVQSAIDEVSESFKSLLPSTQPSTPSFAVAGGTAIPATEEPSYDKLLTSKYLTCSGIDSFMKNGFKGTVSFNGAYTFPNSVDKTALEYKFDGSVKVTHDVDASKLQALITPPTSGTPVQVFKNNSAAINYALNGFVTLTPDNTGKTGVYIEKATLRVNSMKYDASVKGLTQSMSTTDTNPVSFTESSLKLYTSIDAAFVVSSSDATVKGGKIGISVLFDKGISYTPSDIATLSSTISSGHAKVDEVFAQFLSSKGVSLDDIKITVKVWDNDNAEVFSQNYTATEFKNAYIATPVVKK